jgi:hypothetical protein
MRARPFLAILIALAAAVNTAAGQQQDEAARKQRCDTSAASLDHRSVTEDVPDAAAHLEDLIQQLQKLGLRITADQQKIGAATSEAAYFMFADRKEHQPRCEPFDLPGGARWLDGKPVFTPKTDREKIHPLFNRLVKMMGYNEVCIYAADVHYGVSSYAKFTLYKLGYVRDDARRGKMPEVLLGDADYVMNLP